MRKNDWTGERLETFIFNGTTIEHLHRYAIAKGYCFQKRVLDIACGEGYGSKLLAGNATSVTGVDIDDQVITRAKKVYRQDNLNFMTGDCTAIPLPDHSIDVAVSFETLEHHGRHEDMLKELKRVLIPGGILIISTPDKKHYTDETGYQNPFHVKELYTNEFESLIKTYFNQHVLLYQKFVSGSLAFTKMKNSGFQAFSGDYNRVQDEPDAWGVYNICVASDDLLGIPDTSFFNGISAIDQLMTETVSRIQQSKSYRLGHFLLSPFRFFSKK